MVLNKYLLAIINIYDSIFEKSDMIEKHTWYFDYFEKLDSSFRKFSCKSANNWGLFIWIRVVDVTIQYFYETIKKLSLNIIFQIQWLRFRKHRGYRTCLAPPWGVSHEVKTVSTWSESCSPQIHTSLPSPPVWLFGSWAFKVVVKAVIKANNISQFSYMFIDIYWSRVCLCSPIPETLASSWCSSAHSTRLLFFSKESDTRKKLLLIPCEPPEKSLHDNTVRGWLSAAQAGRPSKTPTLLVPLFWT